MGLWPPPQQEAIDRFVQDTDIANVPLGPSSASSSSNQPGPSSLTYANLVTMPVYGSQHEHRVESTFRNRSGQSSKQMQACVDSEEIIRSRICYSPNDWFHEYGSS